MATTIVPPGGSTGYDQIDSSFGKIYQMMAPISGSGGGTGAGGTQPQPVSGGDNDLTQYLRSLTNLAGTQAPGLVQAGTGVLGGGLGVAGGGVDISREGLATTETGLKTLQPSLDFYNKLLSGDPNVTAAALAPTAANIAQITSGATDQASRGMPQGGYRASTLAGLPFQQAAQVGNAALQLQPAAAQALADLGKTQAGIGGMQAQIGQGISGVGTDIGRLGLGLTGEGMSSLQMAINGLLQKAGINVQEGGPLKAFDQFMSGLSQLI